MFFQRKYEKSQSQGTSKHKCHKLTSDPNDKSLPAFKGKQNECAERSFGAKAPQMVYSLSNVKMPQSLKKIHKVGLTQNM